MRKYFTCVGTPCCLALVMLILLPSCDLPPNKSLSDSLKKLQEQNESLSKNVEFVTKQVNDLLQRVMDLERAPYGTAQLDPTVREFQRLDTPVGILAVTIKNVQPFADGVRVLLAIGNPTSAALGNVEVKAKWGKRRPTYKAGEAYPQETKSFLDSLHEKSIKLTNDLKPGYWNKVTLTLPGTPPQEFGYLELSIASAGIALFEPRE